MLSLITAISGLGDISLRPEFLLKTYPEIMKIVFATALGSLLGVEREWSEKPAGLRTFIIITMTATVMTIVAEPVLLVLAGGLVVFQGAVFAVKGLLEPAGNYLLTTASTMVLGYGVGVLIGKGFYQVATIVTVIASFVLVLRRELHGFARGLTKDELRSAIEFGILAFVVFPLLPNESFGPGGAVDPRSVWLLVVAVSGIGFANYLIVQRYGARGIAITSFFGGLVNSAAVVGEIVSRTRQETGFADIAAGAVLLANAAMAFRDLFIVATFVPGMIFEVGGPLLTVVVVGIAASYVVSEWDHDFEIEFESPFNLRTAMKFGVLFLSVLLVSATAKSFFGPSGFLVSSFFGGMISSGAVTTSVVLLIQSGQLSPGVASGGVIAAVSGSILVKLGLVVTMDRSIARPVAVATGVLLLSGTLATALTTLFIT